MSQPLTNDQPAHPEPVGGSPTAIHQPPSTTHQPPSTTHQPPSTTHQPPKRFDYVDGMRAVCALYVVVCHAYYQPGNGYHAARWMSHLGLTHGHIAVVAFIVISGFCLGLGTARRGDQVGSIRTFFVRRAIRILPAYYACVGFSILFIALWANKPTGTVWDNSLPLTWQGSVSHALMLHDLPAAIPRLITRLVGIPSLEPGDRGGDINYPLWSIAVECQLYLLFPAIIWGIRKFGASWTLVAGVTLGFVIHIGTHGRLVTATPWYIGAFTSGIVAAHCVTRGFVNPNHWKKCAIVAGILVFVMLLRGKAFHDRYEPWIDTLLAISVSTYLAAAYDGTDRLKKLLSHRTLVSVGIYSYSLYLIHAPILHALDQGLGVHLTGSSVGRFAFLILCIPIVLALSFGFHVLFERPSLRRLSS